MAESWSDTPVVSVPEPQCSHCSSADLVRVRTNQCKSGDVERLYVCRRCSKRTRWRILASENFPVAGTPANNPAALVRIENEVSECTFANQD